MTASAFVALRWALAVVWVAAGFGKTGDPRLVAATIKQYGILPDAVALPVARLMPAAEVVLGVALAAGARPNMGGWISAAALCILAGAMAWNVSHGRTFDCGCGFSTGGLISWKLVGRNLLLAGVSAGVAIGPSGSLAILPESASVSANAPVATSLLAIPLIVLLVFLMARVLVLTLGNVVPVATVRSANTDASTPRSGLAIVNVDASSAQR